MTIYITERAALEIRKLMAAENLDHLTVSLRMGVAGGGCSGLSYKLEWERTDGKTGENDLLFNTAALETDEKIGSRFRYFKKEEKNADTGPAPCFVVIDKKSYIYLNGVTLDYVAQGLTGGFTFINPNAKSGCGCGSSFSPE